MYARIKELCKKKGTTITALEREIGIAKGSICKWENHEPSGDKLQKVADYFDVTIDYIKTGKEKSAPDFNPAHIELITLYEKLNKEQQDNIMSILRSLAN